MSLKSGSKLGPPDKPIKLLFYATPLACILDLEFINWVASLGYGV